MDAVPPPPPTGVPPEARPLVDHDLRTFAARVIGARVWVAPLVALIAATAILADPVPWRIALLGSVGLTAVVGATLSAWHTRRRGGVGPTELAINFSVMWLLQTLMVVGTGGLDSPLLPILVPIAPVAGLLLGRRWTVVGVVTAEIGMVALVAILQTTGRLPPLGIPLLTGHATVDRAPAMLWTAALVLSVVLIGGSLIGVALRHIFETVVWHALQARSEQLAVWEAWSTDLQRLSAEIAHELKNPLASVKGLSALIARDVPDGRPAGRLTVLRGEVDRMQTILDEFLTFSRPLVPLALEPVVPVALARRVLALHEGVAQSRGVGLEVAGDAPVVQGDPRKLIQVLVNLIQNALHASEPGDVVLVRLGADGEHATIEVVDAGPGVPHDLGERVFAAGVTSRQDGSGLGLTVALAIARQHGGTLSLLDRPGGGTIARLRLPCAGPTEGS